METFYSALQAEIRAFKEQVRSCQEGFDLHALYKVLLLLFPESQPGEVQSIEQLRRHVVCKDWTGQEAAKPPAGDRDCSIPAYVSWLSSYLGYLNSLKDTFDAKVVFPLCENLYVNEEPGGRSEPGLLVGSPCPSGSGHGKEEQPCVTESIADVARQLFAIRRKWALLLQGGMIDDRLLSPQSLRDLQGFAHACPFRKVLKLVPNIFHKSLATAELAQKWVALHRSRYSSLQLPSGLGWGRGWCRGDLAPGTSEHLTNGSFSPLSLSNSFLGGCSQPRAKSGTSGDGGSGAGSAGLVRAQLQESQEELMSLLGRAERAGALEAQLRGITQSISHLHQQQQDKRRELDNVQQGLGQGEEDMAECVPEHSSSCQAILRQLADLGRRLELEEYRKSIVQRDWVLELTVRPALLRHIDVVQQRCRELERVVLGWEEAGPAPLRSAKMTDSVSLPGSAHSSTAHAMPGSRGSLAPGSWQGQ
ncbi:uncharacterized protein LOC112547952 [Alligator sinensis]|uniref:Uncharacterized protein LOC112547952 n=1 Tax=Alligator sinensis TaxID=38654 RepID=A0A3Q0FI84_ALLSI|nr:uncharacterized protein LOC112547952 [Alligator sinensis]